MITWKDRTMLLVTSPLFGPAFQLEIERRFWPLSSLLFLVSDDPLEQPRILHLLVPRVQTTLRLRGYIGLAPNNLSDPRLFNQRVRQARRSPERCRSFVFRLVRFARLRGVSHGFRSLAIVRADPSSSVWSVSQNFVGVSHAFLSLGTVLRARSVRSVFETFLDLLAILLLESFAFPASWFCP